MSEIAALGTLSQIRVRREDEYPPSRIGHRRAGRGSGRARVRSGGRGRGEANFARTGNLTRKTPDGHIRTGARIRRSSGSGAGAGDRDSRCPPPRPQSLADRPHRSRTADPARTARRTGAAALPGHRTGPGRARRLGAASRQRYCYEDAEVPSGDQLSAQRTDPVEHGNPGGLKDTFCNSANSGGTPTTDEVAYATYLLTGTQLMPYSRTVVPRYTLNDTA
jgi:hypothetical protein